MGTWGPGLFEDDDAADLRRAYPLWLADAQSNEGATELAMRDHGADLTRPEADTSFWLALAAVQWKAGRLDDRVLQTALHILENDLDIARWTDSTLRAKRTSTLKKLRAQLTSPSPPPRPFPAPLPIQLPGWVFGELIAYRHSSGKCVILHVLGYRPWFDLRVKAPAVAIMNWFENELPTASQARELTFIKNDGHHLLSLAMPRNRALRDEQFVHLGYEHPVTREEASAVLYDIGGGDGLTLDIALHKLLHAY